MKQSESIVELAKALSKAQAAMQPAKMNSVNPFLKNKYADLGAVIDAAKKPLADNGLSVAQPVEINGDTVGITTILMHASGEWIASEASMPLGEERGKSAAQVAGSIITYLRRYSLASVLGIYADEDTDGNQAKQEQPKRQEPRPAAAIAEELGFDGAEVREAPQPANNSKVISWLISQDLADSEFSAKGMIKLWGKGLIEKADKEAFMEWARNYRSWRNAGVESKAAAENAHAGAKVE